MNGQRDRVFSQRLWIQCHCLAPRLGVPCELDLGQNRRLDRCLLLFSRQRQAQAEPQQQPLLVSRDGPLLVGHLPGRRFGAKGGRLHAQRFDPLQGRKRGRPGAGPGLVQRVLQRALQRRQHARGDVGSLVKDLVDGALQPQRVGRRSRRRPGQGPDQPGERRRSLHARDCPGEQLPQAHDPRVVPSCHDPGYELFDVPGCEPQCEPDCPDPRGEPPDVDHCTRPGQHVPQPPDQWPSDTTQLPDSENSGRKTPHERAQEGDDRPRWSAPGGLVDAREKVEPQVPLCGAKAGVPAVDPLPRAVETIPQRPEDVREQPEAGSLLLDGHDFLVLPRRSVAQRVQQRPHVLRHPGQLCFSKRVQLGIVGGGPVHVEMESVEVQQDPAHDTRVDELIPVQPPRRTQHATAQRQLFINPAESLLDPAGARLDPCLRVDLYVLDPIGQLTVTQPLKDPPGLVERARREPDVPPQFGGRQARIPQP